MADPVLCPVCRFPMKNLGNVSGRVYASYPEQWDEVHVCDVCKVKTNVRHHGKLPPVVDLSGYREVAVK